MTSQSAARPQVGDEVNPKIDPGRLGFRRTYDRGAGLLPQNSVQRVGRAREFRNESHQGRGLKTDRCPEVEAKIRANR
jgi:hypothetical protein